MAAARDAGPAVVDRAVAEGRAFTTALPRPYQGRALPPEPMRYPLLPSSIHLSRPSAIGRRQPVDWWGLERGPENIRAIIIKKINQLKRDDGGWLIICTGLIAPASRPDDAEERRNTQLSEVNGTIRDLDNKLNALSDKLERIGDMALEDIHGSESRAERLNRLESQVQQLRQRASGMDPGKEACGAAAPGGAVESVPAGERR